MGYIGATDLNGTGNFIPYSGTLPHFQILGTQINDAVKDFNTFYVNLNIPVVSERQLSIRLMNNLTVSSAVGIWSQQNAFIVLRF